MEMVYVIAMTPETSRSTCFDCATEATGVVRHVMKQRREYQVLNVRHIPTMLSKRANLSTDLRDELNEELASNARSGCQHLV